MRALPLLLVAAALLLAGCVREPVNPRDPPAEEDKGNLRIVVQGPSQADRRVEGATVLIMPWGHDCTTDEDGICVFTGLEPATGDVRVNKPGYHDDRVTVEVVAGQTVERTVFLDRS